MIGIVVNGKDRCFDHPPTIANLLEREGWLGKRVAVEVNGVIVPKSRHAETLLAPGDKLEIVVAVGGG